MSSFVLITLVLLVLFAAGLAGVYLLVTGVFENIRERWLSGGILILITFISLIFLIIKVFQSYFDFIFGIFRDLAK